MQPTLEYATSSTPLNGKRHTKENPGKLFIFPEHDKSPMWKLRGEIVASPIAVALHRAQTYTRVFQENEGAPWIVKKSMAFRQHLQTVPLFIRDGDKIAGSISEIPGGLNPMVELGIAENQGFAKENPKETGYIQGKIPQDILDYWLNKNLWGQYRAYMKAVNNQNIPVTQTTMYKFISCQGHLSPSYTELLSVGLEAILNNVLQHRAGTIDPEKLEFYTAAENTLRGVMEWIQRYSVFLDEQSKLAKDAKRAADLKEMSRITSKIAFQKPETMHEAMQLVWFVHQAVHIEGHGYSCTPDRVDQIFYPFYLADKAAGRLDDNEALTLIENFILKLRDNTFWSVRHNLTQGISLSGSSVDGKDQTNELSWMFIKAADNMSLPEPLIWIRWHDNIDQEFFDFCIETLAGQTCFPLMMSDGAVIDMFCDGFGVSREDAHEYVAVGCNEIGIPGKAYFNPITTVAYLNALEHVLTQGRGYQREKKADLALPAPENIKDFDQLVSILGNEIKNQIHNNYKQGLIILEMHMRYAQTPFTSCFFDGCVERGADLIMGTKYNILSCGGITFANIIDCLASIRELVFEKKEVTIEEMNKACADNFKGHDKLRAKLQSCPKHGNDDPRIEDIVRTVERLRDEPLKACVDPRDGTRIGNVHIVRSASVTLGQATGATPDGRLAGTPVASSVAASCGAEQRGPTATLNSILAMDPKKSWQCGYNVNMRFQKKMLVEKPNRMRVRAMLNSYFEQGGQEMQINCVDSAILKEAQKNPDQYKDLVVRIAGFSAFFVDLTKEMQDEIIMRMEHAC
jgi:pyruvate-formate lyase